MKLSDQVANLERENERLRKRLEKEEKVRVILKAHGGFVRYEEMRAQDIRPTLIIPEYESFNGWVAQEACQDYLKQQVKCRRFEMVSHSNRGEGFLKTVTYKEV